MNVGHPQGRACMRDLIITEFRLFVYPVVVGRGRRLFPDGTSLTTLHPVENRQSRSGVTLLRYRTA